jgi:hypothetical protein
MGRSRGELLKRVIAAASPDHGTPVFRGPDHLAPHKRVVGETPEPIPDRSLQRIAELVQRAPALDLDKRLALEPPAPARPQNGTTGTDAPRLSSSSHTAAPLTSSRRPGCIRAECGCDASRPEGVEQCSPRSALHVGHGRSSQPRATCRGEYGPRLPFDRRPHRHRLHLAPGAARHSGHHCSSHAARSLISLVLQRFRGGRSVS